MDRGFAAEFQGVSGVSGTEVLPRSFREFQEFQGRARNSQTSKKVSCPSARLLLSCAIGHLSIAHPTSGCTITI